MGKTAGDIMKDPDFINAEASLDEVKKEFEGVENTLIVKKDGKAVGEIHEHSLLKILVPEDRLDEEKVIGILGLSFDKSYVAEKAEDLMVEHEVKVPPEESVGEIAFLMHREDVRSVIVEDEKGEVLGVVHEDTLMEEI